HDAGSEHGGGADGLHEGSLWMRCSAHAEQLDLEDERGVRRDHRRKAARTVPQVRGDGQLALAADAHPLDPLVPPLDDLASPEGKRERAAAVEAGVELAAVLQPPRVVAVPSAPVPTFSWSILSSMPGSLASIDLPHSPSLSRTRASVRSATSPARSAPRARIASTCAGSCISAR